jgi:predicted transglutaminase-like cysteine proteinase
MRIRTAPLLAGLCLCLSLTAWAWDAARIQQQASALSAATQQLTRQLLQLVEAQQGQPVVQQLEQVNRFFNQRMAWRDDQSVWGQVDYWATPLEMFGKGAGDCEDLAMGKYFSLLGLGVAESSLRLVYVRAQWEGRPQAHMVLAWYATPDAEPYILDNLNPKLLKASERPDLQPVFSFNAQGLWQGAGAQAAGNPLTRLTIWRDALARAKAEGF